jgi:flagellin
VTTTKLASSQIIAQAATAMLAQANQSQQGVMALLK